VPTGGNGSLRLAISAKASSPASSSMYLRVRPGVDTGRRAAQAGCGVTPTALDKGKRSPPSSYAPSSHGCSGGRRPFDSYPLPLGRSSQLLSPMPWSRGGGDWYRAGASVLAPVVASPPTPASLSGAAEAKRGEAGSRRGRRPPSSAAASSPAGPQAAGSLTLASHRHSSLRFVFRQ
jgi:hypothetical protein